jgi:hypothetical protein
LKMEIESGVVANVCKHNNLGGRCRRIEVQGPPRQNLEILSKRLKWLTTCLASTRP